MPAFDVKYFERLSEAIGEVEARTTAELVVVVEPWSGSYRDVDFAVGAGTALLLLAGLLFSPWEHHELEALALVALAFIMGARVSAALPALRRRLTRPARREAQVQTMAAAAFYHERVGTTRARTGVLIYVSLLEQQAVVLADTGVTTAVPAPAWNAWLAEFHAVCRAPDPPEALLGGLRRLGEILETALPPSADNPDELPNAARGQLQAKGQGKR